MLERLARVIRQGECMTNDFTEEGPFRQTVKAALMALLDQVDDIDSDEHDPSMTDGNPQGRIRGRQHLRSVPAAPTREFWLSANFTAWHFVSGAAASGWSETTASPCSRCFLASFPTNWGWTYSSPSEAQCRTHRYFPTATS